MSDAYTIIAPDGSKIEARVADTPMLGKIRKLEASGDDQTSPAGAIGRFEITPPTADFYKIDTGRLKNADYAERSAGRIVSALEKRFPNDEDAVVIAYNAGPGVADRWIKSGRRDDVLPEETRKYLARSQAMGRVWAPAGDYTLEGPDGKPISTASPTAPKPAPPKPKPGSPPIPYDDPRRPRIGPAGRTLTGDFIGETRQAFHEGAKTAEANAYDPKASIPTNALRALTSFGGTVDAALAPVSALGRMAVGAEQGLVNSLVKPGQHFQSEESKEGERRFGGEVASGAFPVGFEEKAAVGGAERLAKIAAQKARMAPPVSAAAKHAGAVDRLTQEGVQLTPGMRRGGAARTAEEARKSSPYVGDAVEQGERRAIESVNRAAYNRALKPLGETYTGPVGRDGIGHLQDRLGAAYESILPQVTARMDDEFGAGLAQLADRAKKLGGAEEGRFEQILTQDVHRFFNEGGGAIDGRTFKNIESELGRQARGMKGDPSYKERELGNLVDDLNDLVRDSAERHSPPGVRDKLKAINTGYAVFTRIQDAAARRIGAEDGIFNTGDLMAAVKKGDRSVRKGAFARGDALLQDFAQDAHSVVKAKLPDSGTARRLKQGMAGRVLGGAAGAYAGSHAGIMGTEIGGGLGVAAGNVIDRPIAAATNALARHSMERAARSAARGASRQPQNYLRAHVYNPLVQHRPLAVPLRVNALRSIANAQQSPGE